MFIIIIIIIEFRLFAIHDITAHGERYIVPLISIGKLQLFIPVRMLPKFTILLWQLSISIVSFSIIAKEGSSTARKDLS